MNVDEKYLERFAVQIHGKPSEFAVNGYEQPNTHAIAVDDGDAGTYLAVIYKDDYESPYDTVEGSEKRETVVIVKRGSETVRSVGYRFAGLIKLDNLRTWYRQEFEVKDAGGSA